MKRLLLLVLLCFGLPAALRVSAQAPSSVPEDDEAVIRAAMRTQADAWNRGDIPGFMQIYDNSAETTFIGLTLRKGYQPILERYRQSYTSREQMGTLSFNDVDVRLLPSGCGRPEVALVTGHFHLERQARGEAKKDDGIFSLVWRRTPSGWKIILDHTS